MTDPDFRNTFETFVATHGDAAFDRIAEVTPSNGRKIDDWTEYRDDSSCASGQQKRRCATIDPGDGTHHTHCGPWHCS